jgi:DNA polymerase I-like protein with 3'-5' exonuclease and polymerase domains
MCLTDLLKEINSMGIALWIMDDGSVHDRKTGRLSLAVHSYEAHERNEIVSFFRSRYGNAIHLRAGGDIVFGIVASRLLCNEIGELVPPVLRYKLAQVSPDFNWTKCLIYKSKSNVNIKTKIVSAKPEIRGGRFEKKSYCISVKDNANFFTEYGVVQNCRDTTGTWEAKQNQFIDIFKRGMLPLWSSYVRRLIECVLEMSSNGMPLCLGTRAALKAEVESKVKSLTERLNGEIGYEINPGSWQQKLKFLEANGVAVPKKFDKSKGSYRKSTDSSSLQKIALKHPELKAVPILTDISSLRKALDSYIDFEVKPGEQLVRYSLGKFTETFRFAGGSDPWGRGFNIQTIPREGGDVSIKSMFVAPEKFNFVEVDLRQAESRFVAYDSNDKVLIDMLESDYDVHTHVANEILRRLDKDVSAVSVEEFKKTWRQLGKKAGHGANYSMKAGVFIETCFSEMGIILSKKDAEATLEAYHRLFPGIRKWHEWVRKELSTKRKLSTPFGWERFFYGRLDDSMFREGYAFRPQATIPFITNQLMLHLKDLREQGRLEFHLLLQGHDSLYALVPEGREEDYMRECHAIEKWQVGFDLPGGRLKIPTEIKFGKVVSNLEEWTPGGN